VTGAIVGAAVTVKSGLVTALPGMLALGGIGASAIVANAVRLPRWARLREQQMKDVAERTRALLDPGAGA
jgi:hypothetical protein